MEAWKSFYPNAGQPREWSEPSKITENGKNLVLNVVFKSLGISGVIFLDGTPENYLLVYKSTFEKPTLSDSSVNEGQGGGISCNNINCVQVGVCSTDAYCKDHGSHAYVYSDNDISDLIIQIVDCSFTKSHGNNSVIKYYNIRVIKSTNTSYCKGADSPGFCLLNAGADHNFSIYHNNTATDKYSVFKYDTMLMTIYHIIFSNNFQSYDYAPLFFLINAPYIFTECAFIKNTYRHLYIGQYIRFKNCFFENNKKETGTAEYLRMELSFLSTFLCKGKYKIYEFGKVIRETNFYNYQLFNSIITCIFNFLIK